MKLKKLLFIVLPISLACVLNCTRVGYMPTRTYADDGTLTSETITSSSSSEETTTEIGVENESEESGVKKDFTQLKETVLGAWNSYIAPLLAGVSITSVISMLVSIVFTIKNRKTNKLNSAVIASNDKDIAEVFKMYLEYQATNEKVLNELKESNEISEATRKEFEEKSKALLEKTNEVIESVDNLETLKEVMKDMATILLKIAENDTNLIKLGVTEDIVKLESHINEL